MTGASRFTRLRGAALPWLAAALLAPVLHAAEPEPAVAPPPKAEAEGLPVTTPGESVIAEVHFIGNRVTRERILRQEMLIKEGDIADPLLIERSRQAIMDLGLFTSVRAWLEPADQGGSRLMVAVKEKFYILPVPKLNRDDENNISFGAEVTVDNLAGLNQQVRLRYETEDAANSVSEGEMDTWSFGYYYPRVAGGAWVLTTNIDQVISPAEVVTGGVVTSLYEREAWTASVLASRWLNLRGPSRGWQVGGGVVWRRNSYEYRAGAETDTYFEQNAVGVAAQLQFFDVHDYLYSRGGSQYGYLGEFGEPSFGGDQHYTRHEFYYRRYFLLPGRPHTNVDIQWKLGLSSGEIFTGEQYAYALGGNKSLRGFETGRFTGNAYMLLNAQYLQPLFGYDMFRGVLFLDAGNTYPSNTELHLGDIQWDVGVGLRLRLKSFVKIDLRVDAAYAPDTGEWTYYAGTKELF